MANRKSPSGTWGKALLLQALVSLYSEEAVPEVPSYPIFFLCPTSQTRPQAPEALRGGRRGRVPLPTDYM